MVPGEGCDGSLSMGEVQEDVSACSALGVGCLGSCPAEEPRLPQWTLSPYFCRSMDAAELPASSLQCPTMPCSLECPGPCVWKVKLSHPSCPVFCSDAGPSPPSAVTSALEQTLQKQS